MRGEFAFLNHAERMEAIDWRRRYVDRLWSYNLHYFDYAVDLAWAYRETQDTRFRDRFLALAESWISQTRAVGDGWDPYPLSVRITNWVYALLLFGETIPRASAGRLTSSLYGQLTVLEHRIEWHLMGNHLQKNLQALTIGGLLFSGRSAARWTQRWAKAFWALVDEQVLPDGGHFERSPMYHTIALADFLETLALVRAAGESVSSLITERLLAMARATSIVCRDSGELHLFNDSAQNVAPPRQFIDRLAAAVLGERPTPADGIMALPITGYYGYNDSKSHDRLLVDCGELGPSYQPGHGHCDLLSFELDVGGAQLVVDSGVCGYEDNCLRDYVRSTRAHNTVSVAVREQHELWGVYRVARRARIERASHESRTGGEYIFRGAYRPYYSLATRHGREIRASNGEWCVADRVEGAEGQRIESFVHLHPRTKLAVDGHRAVAEVGSVRVVFTFWGVDDLRVVLGSREPVQGWHCRLFGEAVAAPCLVATISTNDGRAFGYRITREG